MAESLYERSVVLLIYLYVIELMKMKGKAIMEEREFLEQYGKRIDSLERDVCDLREVQSEIRTMNETLITLANELKHTNEHLARHERKIDEMDNVPKKRINQLITAIIGAVAGGLVTIIIGYVIKS